MNLKFVVASILLLLLCSEVLSYRLRKRETEDKSVFAQFEETARGYMNYISGMTQALVDKLTSLDVTQKVWSSYKNITTAVDIYRGIATDQMAHWWHDK